MNKRYGLAAILILITMLMPLSANSPALKLQASPQDTVIRLWGGNRYQTACAVSREGWQSAGTVILTKGEGADTFTDAIAASSLSKLSDAPILFFGTSQLDADTIKEIVRLKAARVYVIGTDDAVFANIKRQLESLNKTVSRISGRDRYETAVKIASEIKNHKPFSKVILTTASQFQYAMMAAPYAAREGIPVLFTENNNLPPSVLEALKSWPVKDIDVIGGQAEVSQSIVGQLKDMGINSSRIDGDGIYEINLKIMEKYFTKKNGIAVARDDQFVDALVGLPLAAKKDMPVALVGRDKAAPKTASYIKSVGEGTHYIFGSMDLISQEVVDALFPGLNPSQKEQMGNTPGNIVNGGYTAYHNGCVYFSNLNDKNKLYKSDSSGNNMTKLSDNKCRSINISDGWVYYINESRNGSMYKIKADGTEEQEVFSDQSLFPFINGNWIYYVNFDDNKSIYKINTNGSSRMKLNDDKSSYINVAGNWIYYSNLSDNGRLYKIKTDGSGRMMLSEDKCSFINVSGSYIYYSNQDDKNSIYKMSTVGSSRSKICSDSASSINLYDDFIYFVISDKNSTIYRIKKDGTEKRFLNYEKTNFINIAGGWLYYYSEDDPGFFRINPDGSTRDYVYSDFIKPLIIPLI